MAATLTIKGIREGLLVSLPEGDWTEISRHLLETVQEQADFFRGANLALQVGERNLGAADLGRLRDALSDHEVWLRAVLTSSDVTREAAADLGLEQALRPERPPAGEELEPLDATLPMEEAVLVERTLRSGHSLRHPGHVVVLGDVNPGAEIIAGGNIIVWGRLRGTVHAGATGNESASVSALDLAPTQLRIAGHISISPARKGAPRPERALVRDGQIVAEPWSPAGGRWKGN